MPRDFRHFLPPAGSFEDTGDGFDYHLGQASGYPTDHFLKLPRSFSASAAMPQNDHACFFHAHPQKSRPPAGGRLMFLVLVILVYRSFSVVGMLLFVIMGMTVDHIPMPKSNDSESYLIGGRKIGAFITAMTLQTTSMSGYMFMGGPAQAYKEGYFTLWYADFETMKETLSFLAEYNHSDFVKGIISLETGIKNKDTLDVA